MNGILVVNKEKGYTSRDVVNIVSKFFNTKKIGHTGTLDPMAEGVLVLCIGNALKISELLTNHDKEYIAGITLGLATDTLDMDGNIIKEERVFIDEDTIYSKVSSFKGEYLQEVPKYSAIKLNGRKLYEYARSGIDVTLPKRKVNIKNIEIIDNLKYIEGKIFFKIKVTVSKGTYIRSLIKDIGDSLGVPSVMNSLIRTKLGDFSIENSYTLEDIKNKNYKIISVLDALPNIVKINVNDELAFKIRNGVILDKFFDEEMAFILDKHNTLLAIYRNIDNKSRVYKMF